MPEMKIVPEDLDPNAAEENYPAKGTPETALVVSLTCDQYHVIHHTGRYFYGQVECAGFQGEDVGISDVPDEPGIWVFESGKVWTSTDWETGIQDDFGIEGTWRKARPEDFEKAGLECPLDLTSGFEREGKPDVK